MQAWYACSVYRWHRHGAVVVKAVCRCVRAGRHSACMAYRYYDREKAQSKMVAAPNQPAVPCAQPCPCLSVLLCRVQQAKRKKENVHGAKGVGVGVGKVVGVAKAKPNQTNPNQPGVVVGGGGGSGGTKE